MVDAHFNHHAASGTEVDEIAEAEGLKLIRYDGFQDGVWFPLNSLVLPKGETDVVFVDDKALSLWKLLEQEGVEVVGVQMPQHEYPAGKIHCQTNTYCKSDGVTPDDLLEEF